MNEHKTPLETVMESVAQIRDEVAVHLHLGQSEAREEWEKLEKKLQELQGKSKLIGLEVEKSAKNAGVALEIAAEELKQGYERIRRLFT